MNTDRNLTPQHWHNELNVCVSQFRNLRPLNISLVWSASQWMPGQNFHDSRSLGSSWCLEAPHSTTRVQLPEEITVRLLSYLRSQGRWRVRAATEATKAKQSERLLWCCNISNFFNTVLSTEISLDFELQLPTAYDFSPSIYQSSFKVSFP